MRPGLAEATPAEAAAGAVFAVGAGRENIDVMPDIMTCGCCQLWGWVQTATG